MLRHYYGKSEVAHGASASFDYLLHSTGLGIYGSTYPDASVGFLSRSGV
jgi:hypothetical protein